MKQNFTLNNLRPAKAILLLTAALCLLTGCDYGYSYTWRIENQTSHTLDISLLYDIGDALPQTFTLVPNTSIKEFIYHPGLCGRGYYPEDRYSEDQSVIPSDYKMNISIDGTALPDDIAFRKYWAFTSKKYSGLYKLTVTQALLDELGWQ